MSGTTLHSENPASPVGAVLVVGAGIGGMQAALDLAEAGLKVYLLERSPAIGGTMAQLDKTFPTNDCAMCIMSPKLVEVGRHLNIEIITTAEVAGIQGEAGNYQVQIRKRPRYVNIASCTGCGDCAEACPISRLDIFNGGLSQRKAIYKPYPQAIPNAYAIEKLGTAPCRDACPIHQRAQGYLALIREGRYADAYRTIKEDNPFPSVCGRVCNHRCEDACSRGQAGEPVNIMALKRFVADWMRKPVNSNRYTGSREENPASGGRSTGAGPGGAKIAIVGSGPAGLTCALDLVRKGHSVTVFEALPVPGGMLRVGVPAYRLPPEVVQAEIDEILAEGVELVLGRRIEDVPGLLEQGYQAVFFAAGAHQGVKLPIPGADLPEVTVATDFLREVALNMAPTERLSIGGRRVLILGGGNVAIDAAMSAVRLGARWVGMACLESRAKMPAHDWEVRDAEAEGVVIFPSRTFKEITQVEGHVAGVRCVGVDFRGFVDGRPDFDEIPGTEEVIPAEVVIFAIGQRPEIGCLGDKVETVRGRFPRVDPDSLATSLPGVFAGGDAVTGTAFIVDAIAAGHQAARSIEEYLHGRAWLYPRRAGEAPTLATGGAATRPVAALSPEEIKRRIQATPAARTSRHEMKPRPAAERRRDFHEVYAGLTEEEARAEAARCLGCGICSECLQCVYACRANAIDHEQVEEIAELQVGAVILAPGLEPLSGSIRPEYGYGRYPNVVTSLEFERMLSASGPFGGVVQRPSDGKHPRKIAWIQCVGSRDERCDQGYCSSVCCMYATKEAIIAREHDPDIEPTVFYIDLRAFGKGFDAYLDRAAREQGVRYVRSMVAAVKEIPGTHNLRLSYAAFEPIASSGGQAENLPHKPVPCEEEFDLVVLSVGLRPSAEAIETARRLGVDLNRWGFAQSPLYHPAQTSRPGIYVAGSFGEPKDIPETVIEASCAAAQASALLAGGRGSLTRQAVYPPERDVREEPPRVGVFVCHCGINIGGVVDVPQVVERISRLPGVVYAERNLYTCSQDTQEKIKAKVQEYGLNRVVVASCTPRTHEPLFQDTIRQAGLNPHLFELANIREQDAWVHRSDPASATQKAIQLVEMAVAKAIRLQPLQRGTLAVQQRALVIGGGLAGMTAALSIASQGFPVTLVEREAQLGGNLRHIFTGIDASDPQQLLSQTIAQVSRDPRITVLLQSQVVEVSGYVGNFTVKVERRESRIESRDPGTTPDSRLSSLDFGAIVVATGGREITPRGFGYGFLPGVITQRELEAEIGNQATGQQSIQSHDHPASLHSQAPDRPGALIPPSFVMIQCVGSRDDDHPYCSRICCTQAIKNALEIKRQRPEATVYILYRDLRSYGFRERLYRQARQAGVIFIPYDPFRPPQVSQSGEQLQVQVLAQPENELLAIPASRVVLSAGIEAEPGNEALSRLLKLPLTAERFFLEAHVKLRPVDFAADGITLCGLAHSPRSLDETIAQAQAAAIRVVALLAKKQLTATPLIASVNPRLCSACGLCVEVCPFGARRLEPSMEYAEVVDVLCQGCGACVAACPNKASQQRGFEFLQVSAMLDAAMESI